MGVNGKMPNEDHIRRVRREIAKVWSIAARMWVRTNCRSKSSGESIRIWRIVSPDCSIYLMGVRQLDSIRLLAEGKSVTDAALDTGYSSVSAFLAAFKDTFGYTPGRL